MSMSDQEFTNEYRDVLFSIESAVMDIYQAEPALTDHQVDKVLEMLFREYTAQRKGRKPPKHRFSDVEDRLYGQIKTTCEWYRGEATLSDEETGEEIQPPVQRTTDEIIASLKRLRRSVKLWNKDYGRRGYLDYISQFLSGDPGE